MSLDRTWLGLGWGDGEAAVKSGVYYEGRKEIRSSEVSYDRSKQEDLWDWTVKHIAQRARGGRVVFVVKV